MNWINNRPENWVTLYRRARKNKRIISSTRNAFEAGADAMYEPAYSKGKEDGREELLEGLKREGCKFNQFTAMDCFAQFANPGMTGGWLVLIEDKK